MGKIKMKGFTLIELLVVVLIIGILSSIALPQYQKAVAKSRVSAAKPLLKAIMDSQTVYFLANGKFSGDFEELDIQLPSGKVVLPTQIQYQNGYCYIACNTSETLPYNCGGCVVWLSKSNGVTLVADFKSRQLTCIAYDGNALGHSICRSETGKSAPSSDDGHMAYYPY